MNWIKTFFRKNNVEHDWEFILKSHDEKTHREYKLFSCKACDDFKKEYTGNTYQIKHKCEFCDSTETLRYPAEGHGNVWLCEDCYSRSND